MLPAFTATIGRSVAVGGTPIWRGVAPAVPRDIHPHRTGGKGDQVCLREGSDDLDDASRGNIRVLKLLAEELIERNTAELDQLCASLTADSMLATA